MWISWLKGINNNKVLEPYDVQYLLTRILISYIFEQNIANI